MFIFFTGIHQFLISLMGTVGEILFSFLLAWYALSKVKNKLDMKGVFYMFLSMLLWVNIVSFAWSLIFDTQAKIKYSNGIQQVLGGDPLTNDLVKLYDASSLPVTFYSWLLLILSALSIYLLSRMVDVKFPTKQKFKDYFMALFAILKIQTVSLINRFK